MPLGFWIDGVPMNYDRTESAEVITMNFPGQSGEYRSARIPLTTLGRKSMVQETWDDLFEILCWSLQHAAAGVAPLKRHDGAPWEQSEHRRRKRAGQGLGVRGVLCEIRGDWLMFAETFRFPRWSEKANICWKCEATRAQVTSLHTPVSCAARGLPKGRRLSCHPPHREGLRQSSTPAVADADMATATITKPHSVFFLGESLEIAVVVAVAMAVITATAVGHQVTDCGREAVWRQTRRTHWQLILALLQRKATIAPVLTKAPWCDIRIFRIDWLHTVDQGIAADFLASLFLVVCRHLEGANHKARVGTLWGSLRAWYQTEGVADRLQSLVPTMIKAPDKRPKLRCKAAECRALVPFALVLARKFLAPSPTPREKAISCAMEFLSQCYQALGSGSIFSHDVLKESGLKFALQYCALAQAWAKEEFFQPKPKLHLFMHLCEEGAPVKTWTYRDEDFGGSIAAWARRRGGARTTRAFSQGVLDRFRIKHPVLRMREEGKNKVSSTHNSR